MCCYRRGFTLIELLVVIAIIAILAAILFPAFLQAKFASQRSRCLGNLKQLGTASHVYADVYNDYYPPARVHKDNVHWPFGDWNDGHPYYGNDYLGARAITPYAKNKKIFFCPSNKLFKSPPYWGPGGYWCGYCYWGHYLLADKNSGVQLLTRKEVAVKASEYPYSLLFSDIIVTGTADNTGKPIDWNSHVIKDVQGGSLLYNDGHAKWKNFREMKKLVTISGSSNGPHVDFYW